MNKKSRFIVKKNTLPYVHQWAVIDTQTSSKVGEYKTQKMARAAAAHFEQHGLENNPNTSSSPKNAWNAAQKRMENPEGDKLPRHSSKRQVELDE
jgi:hypothetical protein